MPGLGAVDDGLRPFGRLPKASKGGNRGPEGALGEVAKRVLEPNRLEEMVHAYVRAGSEREDQNRERLADLAARPQGNRSRHCAPVGARRQGVMDAEDPALRERLIGLRLRRDELAKDASGLHCHIASGTPQVPSCGTNGQTALRPA